MNQEKLICDATCETSDLIQKLDSSCNIGNLIDVNKYYTHVSLSCYETQNDDFGDIYASEPNMEDDEISFVERHTKGINSKLVNKMVFDGKDLGENGKCI
jgi:hypothetical protein